MLYGCSFSAGVVVSMLATPLVAKPFGWPLAFKLYSLLGLIWAVSAPSIVL